MELDSKCQKFGGERKYKFRITRISTSNIIYISQILKDDGDTTKHCITYFGLKIALIQLKQRSYIIIQLRLFSL